MQQHSKLDTVDPKWQNLQIYLIICMNTGKMYVGSTVQKLKRRMRMHLTQRNCTSRCIIDQGNFEAITLQKWPCNTKREALTLEGQWQRAFKDCFPKHLVNDKIEGSFINDSPEAQHAYETKRYQEDRENQKARVQAYRAKNPDKVKKYREEHKEERYEYNKAWCEKNRDKKSAIQKRHYDKNRDELNTRHKGWCNQPWTCQWCNATMKNGNQYYHKKKGCKSKPTHT